MFTGFLLLTALESGPTITLAEAKTMTPTALAARLLPYREPRPVVDAIINGRGLTPPSQSVNRVWLVEEMVPFDATACRSHAYVLEMQPVDPAAQAWSISAVATHPKKIEQTDRLWVPPRGAASVAACAAAPAQASGFHDGGLGLERASDLVNQAREAFRSAQRFTVRCTGERGGCGDRPRETLAALDWSQLGGVEQVSRKGEPYYLGDPKPPDKSWGPEYVQFTFPYAAAGATWVITVRRGPDIMSVRMDAQSITYD